MTKSEDLRFAYAEVLDATKHQDAKIGRLLTAIAFLTAAALGALSFTDHTIGTRFTFGTAQHPVVAYLLAGFIAIISLAVVWLILTVQQPHQVMYRRSSGSRERSTTAPSGEL